MRALYGLFLFVGAMLLSSCGSKSTEQGAAFTLKFGHLASEDNTWHLAAVKFKELVEERSAGRIAVKVYPNSQLGKEMELINSIQLGTADMTITGESLQNWAPKAALLAVPYAFASAEEMRAAASGPGGEEIATEITEKTGLVPLAWFERGPRHLTSNRPIMTPDDLNALKIRVPNVPLFVKVWQELGAKPTPMAFSEVFTSLQQNTIEAQENPLSLIDSASFFEVQKHVNLTAHVRSWIYVVIGEKKLNGMPEDLQTIVRQAAMDMQAYEHELFLAEETQLRKKLEGQGMTFIDSDQAAFAEKARSAVTKALTDEQRTLLEQFSTPRKTDTALRGIEVLLEGIVRAFNTAAVVALLAIVAVVLYQIFARYALPKSPVWTEELSRYLFAYAIVLASGAVLVRKRHVSLELFHHQFSERTQWAWALGLHLLIAVFALILLPHAWEYAANGHRQTSPALGVKLTWIFASTVVFFGLVAVVSLLLAARDALRLLGGGKA